METPNSKGRGAFRDAYRACAEEKRGTPDRSPFHVKFPAHRAGLPGKEVSFILCPSTPPIPLWRDGARSGQLVENLGQFRAPKRQEFSGTWSSGVSGKEHYQEKGRDVKIEEDSRRCAGGPDCAKSRLAERRRAWQTLHFLGSFEG